MARLLSRRSRRWLISHIGDAAALADGFMDHAMDTSSDQLFQNVLASPSVVGGSPAALTSPESIGCHMEHSSPEDSAGSLSAADGSASPDSSRGGVKRARRFRCLEKTCTRMFTSECVVPAFQPETAPADPLSRYRYTRKTHMQTHKPRAPKSLQCETCKETFSRRHDLLRHEVVQHGKECEWVCDLCGLFFSSSKTLQTHRCRRGLGQSRWPIVGAITSCAPPPDRLPRSADPTFRSSASQGRRIKPAPPRPDSESH